MRQVFALPAICAMHMAAVSALAHGPQLQVTIDGDQLVTRRIILEAPYSSVTPLTRVYVIPMLPFEGTWYSRPNNEISPITTLPTYFSGPGLAYGSDQADGGLRTFAADSALSLDFTAGLQRWNGGTYVDPGTEQIESFRGSANAPSASAITSDVGPFAGLPFPPITTTYDVNAHSSARFRLLGDGADPLSVSQDGVYLLGMQAASDQVGLLASDEFFFVLHKNAAAGDVAAAVAALEFEPSLVQIIPEPTSLWLAIAGAAMFAPALRPRRAQREDMK